MAVTLKSTMGNEAKKLAVAYSDIVIYATNISQILIAQQVAGVISNLKYFIVIIINGKAVATLKAPVDDNDNAIFKIDKVLQDFTETDKSGYDLNSVDSTFQGQTMFFNNHSIHQIDKFARNRDNLKSCALLGGHEYVINNNLVQEYSITSTIEFNYFNGVYQHNQGYNQDWTDYILNGSQKKFLTKFPNNFGNIGSQKIQLGQYHTIAFLNGKHHSTDTDYHSNVAGVRYLTYDANDNQIDAATITNTSTNGGSSTDDVIIGQTVSDNTDEGLLYFGCGTQNLVNAGVDLTNVAYYYIVAVSGGAPKSLSYRFDIQDADCKNYETIRLAFLNSLGAYDYYNFTKKSVRSTQINKSVFKQNYGSTPFQYNSGIGDLYGYYYNQGTYEGGTRAFNVNAVETIEANTDFIREDEAAILEELFTSPDVYMQTGDVFEPVVISETEYIKQTTANDMLKQYIITIEKGHNTRVQRL